MSVWVETPELRVPVGKGKGASLVTGRVRIVFNGKGRAYVSTDGAHHNDDAPGITFRDREWLISMHAVRAADGTWAELDPRAGYAVKAGGIDVPYDYVTPKTYRAAIASAMLETVADYWTPELDQLAAYADAAQSIGRAQEKVAEAAKALAEAEETRRAIQADMDAHAREVDGRYSVAIEYGGRNGEHAIADAANGLKPGQAWVMRFCGEWAGAYETEADALTGARAHYIKKFYGKWRTPLCGYTSPQGQIPMTCTLPSGHEGMHSDGTFIGGM